LVNPNGFIQREKMAKLQEKKILKNVADRNTAHGMHNTACGAIKKIGFF